MAQQGQDQVQRFRLARQVILFLLGVVVIVDGIVSSGTPVPEIVTGLVLIGLVPIDDLMSRIPRPAQESPPPKDTGPPRTSRPPSRPPPRPGPDYP